jgi:hypothetical protein
MVQTRVDAGGRAWRLTWRAFYAMARRIGPATRALVWLRIPTFHNEVVELPLVGRRTGRARPVIVGLIRHGEHWYVGHPNGPRPWLANLAATDSLVVTPPRSSPLRVRAIPLEVGAEREAVIRAGARQLPLPIRPLYVGARGHILRAGLYYRLHPLDGDQAASARGAGA